MNAKHFWEQVCEKYPEFRNEEKVVKLRVRGLRRLIEQGIAECSGTPKAENASALKRLFGIFK